MVKYAAAGRVSQELCTMCLVDYVWKVSAKTNVPRPCDHASTVQFWMEYMVCQPFNQPERKALDATSTRPDGEGAVAETNKWHKERQKERRSVEWWAEEGETSREEITTGKMCDQEGRRWEGMMRHTNHECLHPDNLQESTSLLVSSPHVCLYVVDSRNTARDLICFQAQPRQLDHKE